MSHQARRKQLLARAGANHEKRLVTEGQAEPWEAVTVPANPLNQAMYSCPAEQILINFTTCKGWFGEQTPLYAYLFRGAAYWMLRKKKYGLKLSPGVRTYPGGGLIADINQLQCEPEPGGAQDR
jgi:hypothetical protein